MTKFYAGIGSRRTPLGVLETMTRLAGRLCNLEYILRSGGAEGADTAFEKNLPPEAKVIFRARDATPEAIALAATVHPAWYACSPAARQLHGRNCMIILGANLDEPAKFVICWQDPTVDRGGTRLGMNLAASRGIPVYNLAIPGAYKLLLEEQRL